MNIVVIQSDYDAILDWSGWQKQLETVKFENLDGTFLARKHGVLLGILEDRFGWDFIYKVEEGLIIEDRNTGEPVLYYTKTPEEHLKKAVRLLPEESLSWEKPSDIWLERWERFKEESDEEEED